MRKTFKMFCAAAVALLAVSSCGKIWDEFDSVNGEIDAINKELADLKAKVADLEAKLNSDVAAINSELEDVNAALAINVKFQIDPETLEVSVSYDDGATWVKTGIICNDATVAVDYEEGSDFLTLVVGGTEYSVSVYEEDNSSLVLGATKFFLHYEGTRAVELVAEGISEYYVMAKPDGWRAFMLDETTLWVIAPTYKQLAAEAAEEEGEILVHGTTADGKCKVAKIEVTTGPGLTLELLKGGNVAITNSYAAEEYNMWGEYMGFNFSNFHVGFATDVESFKADPTAYLSTYETEYAFPNWDPAAMFYNNYSMEFKPYEPGVYETDELTANIAELYQWMAYEELPYGSTHIFWICAADEEGMPDPRTVQYVEYSHIQVNAEVTEVTHNDATVTLDLKGADKYYVGLVNAWFEADGMTLEYYMEQSAPWSYLVNGYGDYIEDMQVVDGQHTIKLSEVNWEEPLAFGTKYYFWVFPYIEGTVYNDYASQFEPYVFEVTTKDIVAGGAYEVTFSNPSSTYDSVSVDVAFSEGTGSVYYEWFNEEDYLLYENEADLIEAVFASYNTPMTEGQTVSKNYLNPGETWYLATVSVGNDGVYGAAAVQKLQTLTIPHDDAISVELESLTLADKKYTAVLKVTGATKVVGYNLTDSEDSRDYNIASAEKNIVKSFGTYYNYQWVDVVDGKATVIFSESSYKKDYYVWGYNVNAEGGLAGLQTQPLIFNLAANLPAAE